MRLHLYFPFTREDEMPLSAAEIRDAAQIAEACGFSGIWAGHHIPIPGDGARQSADPLMSLALAATATETIEIGTCVYCFGPVNPGNFAQSAYTLESFAPHRVTLGLGTGSQKQEWDVVGLEWGSRFRRMDSSLEFVKAIFSGSSEKAVGQFQFDGEGKGKRYHPMRFTTPGEPTVAMKIGSPRFMLGTWRSPAQLRRAATQYDGWMGSAGPATLAGGWRKVFTESMKVYRDAGGERAAVSTMLIDAGAPASSLSEDGAFDLVCPPEVITERLGVLEEVGFDDVIVSPWDSRARYYRMLTREIAEEIRSLYPIDSSVAWAE